MKAIYPELADRFRGEVKDLDRVVHRTLQAWERAKTAATDQDIYLDAVALNLHGFYSGLERLFELLNFVLVKEHSAFQAYSILVQNVPL